MKQLLFLLAILQFFSCSTNEKKLHGTWTRHRNNKELTMKITEDSIFQYCNKEFIQAFKYTFKDDTISIKLNTEELEENQKFGNQFKTKIPVKFYDDTLIIYRLWFRKEKNEPTFNSDIKSLEDDKIKVTAYKTVPYENELFSSLDTGYYGYIETELINKTKKYLTFDNGFAKVREMVRNYNKHKEDHMVLFGPRYDLYNVYANIIDTRNSCTLENSSPLTIEKKRSTKLKGFLSFGSDAIDTINVSFKVNSECASHFQTANYSGSTVFLNGDTVIANLHTYNEKDSTITLIFPRPRALDNWDSLDSLNLTKKN